MSPPRDVVAVKMVRLPYLETGRKECLQSYRAVERFHPITSSLYVGFLIEDRAPNSCEFCYRNIIPHRTTLTSRYVTLHVCFSLNWEFNFAIISTIQSLRVKPTRQREEHFAISPIVRSRTRASKSGVLIKTNYPQVKSLIWENCKEMLNNE